MQAPIYRKQVCIFKRTLSYYSDIFPYSSHILASPEDLTGKGTIHRIPAHQKAFNAWHALTAEDVLHCYPDHQFLFHICTDTSDFHLGSVILQQNVPVSLTLANSLLHNKIILTLKGNDCQKMKISNTCNLCYCMWGFMSIHTYHGNHMYETLTAQCVLCWHFLIVDFHPAFHNMKGVVNVIAETDSKLPKCTDSLVKTDLIQPDLDPEYNAVAFCIDLNNCALLDCL